MCWMMRQRGSVHEERCRRRITRIRKIHDALDSTFFSLAHNATAGKNGDKAATPPRFAGNGQARLVAVQGMFDDSQAKAGATRFA